MTIPKILYDNRFLDNPEIEATDTAEGYDVRNIIDLRPYTYWKSASAGTKYLTVDCQSVKNANTFAIISHNLKTANATVSVESSPDNSNWTERLAGFIPADDKIIFKEFALLAEPVRYWRVKIVTETIQPKLGVILLGVRLEMPYPPDSPYIPYSVSIETDTARSKAGQLLGSVIRFKPISITARFSNLLRTWIESYFKPFWDDYASEFKPFFYEWNGDAFFVALKENSKYETPLSVSLYADSIVLDLEGIQE